MQMQIWSCDNLVDFERISVAVERRSGDVFSCVSGHIEHKKLSVDDHIFVVLFAQGVQRHAHSKLVSRRESFVAEIQLTYMHANAQY